MKRAVCVYGFRTSDAVRSRLHLAHAQSVIASSEPIMITDDPSGEGVLVYAIDSRQEATGGPRRLRATRKTWTASLFAVAGTREIRRSVGWFVYLEEVPEPG